MGPLAIAIVVVASVIGAFIAVMAGRGLLADLGPLSRASCSDCGRFTVVPLPASQRCWRCRHHRMSGVAGAAARHVHH